MCMQGDHVRAMASLAASLLQQLLAIDAGWYTIQLHSAISKLQHVDNVCACACAFNNLVTQQMNTEATSISSSSSSSSGSSSSSEDATALSTDEKKWLKASKDPKLKLAVTEWEAVHLSDRPEHGVQVCTVLCIN
jgi:hypothetical protein